jgi:hypothetical protein
VKKAHVSGGERRSYVRFRDVLTIADAKFIWALGF